jgi:WD40 repeat protein
MEIADDPELTPLFLTARGRELLWVKPTVVGGLELHRRSITTQATSLVRALPLPGVKTANLRAPLWAISPDGRWLARTGEQGTVDVWSLVNPNESAHVIGGNDAVVTHLAFSPDSSALAIGHTGGRISIWYPASDRPTASQKLVGELSSLAWSPDGGQLALAGENRTIRICDPVSGQELQTLIGHKRLITALAYSPDGRTLASADGRTIKLWHAATGREMLTIHRDLKIGETVQWLDFTPDGNRLLAGDAGGRVMVFAATPIREF